MLEAVLQAHWIGWRKHGYVVPLGASTPIATVGHVRAALELQEQIRAGLLPEPRSIYLPFATGGSVAGLLIGLTLAGMATRVVAVQTVDGIIANKKRLERLVKRLSPCWGLMLDFFTVARTNLISLIVKASAAVMRRVFVTLSALQFMLSKKPEGFEGSIDSPEPPPISEMSPHSRLTVVTAGCLLCFGHGNCFFIF